MIHNFLSLKIKILRFQSINKLKTQEQTSSSTNIFVPGI
jgi:hypothetical protein